MAFQYKIFNTLWADSYRPKVQMTVFLLSAIEVLLPYNLHVFFIIKKPSKIINSIFDGFL